MKNIIVTKHETKDVFVARFEGRKQHVVSPTINGTDEAVSLLLALETYCDGIERNVSSYNVVIA